MTKRIGIAAVFLVGCAVGGGASQLVVPKASAQQAAALTRWEYRCMTETSWNTLREGMNGAGAQGWELVSHTYDSGITTPTTACFKRPKM
jgi:hypothetical protein